MSSYWLQAVPLLMVFAVFYCIAIRPGRVAEGKRYTSVTALTGGERIVTAHGMFGEVTAVHRSPPKTKGLDDEFEMDVEIAPGVTVRVRQEGIKEVLAAPKSTPAVPAETADPTDTAGKAAAE